MPRNLFDDQAPGDRVRDWAPTVAVALCALVAACALLFVAFALGAKHGASSVKPPSCRPLQIECVPVPGMDDKPTIRNAS
jgi:hypothetical protein